MKSVFNKYGKFVGLVGGVAASVPAMAASYIDPSVSGVFTQLQTDAGTLFGFGYALLGIVVGGLIVMSLVSRLAKKGAGGR